MRSPEQVSLFPSPIDFAALDAIKAQIAAASHARNTLKTYRCAWGKFEEWCRLLNVPGRPATPSLLIDHAAWCIAEGYRFETIVHRIKAVDFEHRQHGLAVPYDDSVRQFLSNARRDLCERPQGKEALTPRQLRAMAGAFHQRGRLVDLRDGAMIVLGFACGWRCSEIVSLDLAHVRWPKHGLTLWLGKSKTDQTGSGRLVGIYRGKRGVTCPVRWLDEWLKVRGRWAGPLFTRCTGGYLREERLDSDGVRCAVKRGLELIGEDPRLYGAHSLRAGMITAALEAHATETSVMMRTGHRSYQTLRRYVRPATMFHSDPLAGVL
jgi:integrase